MRKTLNNIAVIPARWASTRLPGKPLVDIDGLPMVVRVARQAEKAGRIDAVIVATDDKRIAEAVESHGFEAVMTSAGCQSGTDRIAEAVSDRDCRIVVNVQGDEPFLKPESIDAAVALLESDSNAEMGTLCCPIKDKSVYHDPNTVKVVVGRRGQALYFSRAPIPHHRDQDTDGSVPGKQHIGLYVYKKDFLIKYATWPQSVLEQIEKLEQLRALEHGVEILVAEIKDMPLSVDTPEDLEMARAFVRSFKK